MFRGHSLASSVCEYFRNSPAMCRAIERWRFTIIWLVFLFGVPFDHLAIGYPFCHWTGNVIMIRKTAGFVFRVRFYSDLTQTQYIWIEFELNFSNADPTSKKVMGLNKIYFFIIHTQSNIFGQNLS